jgi:hypothetical protein
MRSIGAIFVAFLVLVTVTAVGAVISKYIGTDTALSFDFLYFTSNFLAVVIGAYIVPREQRKTAALVLWILLAVPALLGPVLSGHLTVGNILAVGLMVAGGGVAYFLARTGLLSGRKINRVSNIGS